jgi:hypothetical protein
MKDTSDLAAGPPPAFDRSFLRHPQIEPDLYELSDHHVSPGKRPSSPFLPRAGDPTDPGALLRLAFECEVRANRLEAANDRHPTGPNARGRQEDAAAYRAEARRLRDRCLVRLIEQGAGQQEAASRTTDLLEGLLGGAPAADRLEDDGDPLGDVPHHRRTGEGRR